VWLESEYTEVDKLSRSRRACVPDFFGVQIGLISGWWDSDMKPYADVWYGFDARYMLGLGIGTTRREMGGRFTLIWRGVGILVSLVVILC
jgi:hypothetical protein